MMRVQYKTYLQTIEKYLSKTVNSTSTSTAGLLGLKVIAEVCDTIGEKTLSLKEMEKQACSDGRSISKVVRRFTLL
jgi:hypothetical protein